MAMIMAKTLLNNQSILEKITLVEEIGEQAAEVISGGQSVQLLNKGISAFDDEEDDTPDPIIPHPQPIVKNI